MAKLNDRPSHNQSIPVLSQTFLCFFHKNASLNRQRSCPSFCQHLGLFATLGFLLAFFLDVYDLILSQQNGRDIAYQKVNVIVVMIGYSTSQIAYLHACLSCLYTMLNVKKIVLCIEIVKNAVNMLDIRAENYNRTRWIVYSLTALTCVLPIFCVIYDRSFTLFMTVKYAFWSLTRWKFIVYVYLMLSVARFVGIQMLLLQYNLCCIIHQCTEELVSDAQILFEHIKKDPLPSETYVQHLKTLRQKHETIRNMVEAMQEAFSGKFVIDLVTGLFEILVAVCWYCMWMAIPSAGNSYKASRIFVTFCAGLMQMVLLMKKPLKINHTSNLLEELLKQLGQQRWQQLDKQAGLPMEEADLYQAFMTNTQNNKLRFTAGYLMDLDQRSLFSVVLSLAGFLCFVIERVDRAIVDTRATEQY